MKPLRCLLWVLSFLPWRCFCSKYHGQLRQMQVVSVGEGNVECGSSRGVPCGDAMQPAETPGVLLLPVAKSGGWHAFNVHTVLLPEHEASLAQQASQGGLRATVIESSGRRRSFSGILLILMLFLVGICIAISYSGGPSGQEQAPEGSWMKAYREAEGRRKHSMDLLFKTNIIETRDMTLTTVEPKFITESVKVADQMLQMKPIEYWVTNRHEAQQTFERLYSDSRRSSPRDSPYAKDRSGLPSPAAQSRQGPVPAKDLIAGHESADGTWATDYRRSDEHRQQAIELLLTLGIVSTDEFANSFVPQKYVDDRVKVAMNLLDQKPLSEWVDLSRQEISRDSVMACFASPGDPRTSPPTSMRSVTSPSTTNRATNLDFTFADKPSSGPDSRSMAHSDSAFTFQDPLSDSREPAGAADQSRMPSSFTAVLDAGEPPGTVSSLEEDSSPAFKTVLKPSSPGEPTTVSSRVAADAAPPVATNSPGAASGQQPQGAFVLPIGPVPRPGLERATTMPATSPALGGSSTSLTSGQTPWALADGNRGRPGLSRTLTPPPTAGAAGSPSQGWPVQIKFASNAISGSSWEASAAASLTPPGSERFPRSAGSLTPPTTPPNTEKSVRAAEH